MTTSEITSKNVSDIIMTLLRSHCEVILLNNDFTTNKPRLFTGVVIKDLSSGHASQFGLFLFKTCLVCYL